MWLSSGVTPGVFLFILSCGDWLKAFAHWQPPSRSQRLYCLTSFLAAGVSCCLTPAPCVSDHKATGT
jgi:hypothetical protein